MLDFGEECWINLVGLRKSVRLSLLDLREECWIKLVGPVEFGKKSV